MNKVLKIVIGHLYRNFNNSLLQAAIGPVALDIAKQRGAGEDVQLLATYVLTIAVISILLTAPLGAVGIALSGPKLLNRVDRKKETPSERRPEENTSV